MLGDAVDFDEGVSGYVVGVFCGFIEVEYGRETDVAAFHDLAPLGACLGFDDGGEFRFEFGPSFFVHLILKGGVVDPGFFEEECVELGFD